METKNKTTESENDSLIDFLNEHFLQEIDNDSKLR